MSTTNKPQLRWGTETKTPMSDAQSLIRLGVALFVVLNPFAAVIGAVVTLVLRRLAKVKAWWVLVAGTGGLLVALWNTQAPAYVRWLLELGEVALSGLATRTAPATIEAMGALVAQQWPAWLLAQLPVAVPLGVIAGAGLDMWRRRHSAPWRSAHEEAAPMSREKAMKRLKKIQPWADAPPPADARGAGGSSKGSAPKARRRSTPMTVDRLRIRLGVDQATGKPADVPAASFLQGCFVDGATGFGKTTDIVAIARGFIEAPAAQPLRCPLVYVNMKPDPEVTDLMRRIAVAGGRRFWYVTLDGAQHYNPIRHGSPTALATRIVEVEEAAADGGFSEPYHKTNGQELLGYAARALDELIAGSRTYQRGGKTMPWRRDLFHLHRIMRAQTLLENRRHYSSELQVDLGEYEDELQDKKKRESAESMRARIGKILQSSAGTVVRETPEALDLEDALRAGDVVMFDLDSMQDGVGATMLANLVIKDLQATVSRMGATSWHKRDGQRVRMGLTIIDEFSALGGSAVVHLLQRSRSSGFGQLLATQDVGSILEAGGEALLTTIGTNTNVKLVHVQEDRAEEYASAWGTKKAMKETVQYFDDRTLAGVVTSASGQGSLREVDEFVIHPNVLKKLQPGEIILATKTPHQQRRVVVQSSKPPQIEHVEPAGLLEAAPSEEPAEDVPEIPAEPVEDVFEDPTVEGVEDVPDEPDEEAADEPPLPDPTTGRDPFGDFPEEDR